MTYDPKADYTMRNWRAMTLFGIPTAILITFLATLLFVSTSRAKLASEILYSGIMDANRGSSLAKSLRDREKELGPPLEFEAMSASCQVFGSPCQVDMKVKRGATWHREIFYFLGPGYQSASVTFHELEPESK